MSYVNLIIISLVHLPVLSVLGFLFVTKTSLGPDPSADILR
ncbi:hypothetical protein ACFL2C_01250 [Patescibacteria group bacterium]